MQYVLIVIVALALVAYIIIRWQKKSLLKKMSDAVTMVKVATFARLERRYKSNFNEEFASRLAAAVTNELFSEKPPNEKGATFAEENTELVNQKIAELKDDLELRKVVTQAVRVQTALMFASKGQSFDPMHTPVEHLNELELLVPGGESPTPETFLPLAVQYYQVNTSEEESDISNQQHLGLSTPGVWRPGIVIDKIYEVVRELGRGGMGVVYLLRDRSTGRFTAAKLPTGEFSTNPELRKRFTREVQAWTELAAHPNIVRAYEVKVVDYIPSIFMEYVDGETVVERLEASPSGLPYEEAFSIAIQTCWAMAFAHEKGHVHRDLKPANLLCTSDGVVKVSDFGLVRPVKLDEKTVKQNLGVFGMSFDPNLATSMTQGSAVGTIPYMAPEQWEGEATFSVDLYAFGVTLCELFCGQRPLDLNNHPKWRDMDIDPRAYAYFYRLLHQQEQPLDPASLRRGLPSEVRDLILQCLAKVPEERPANFDRMADDLVQAYENFTGQRFPLKKPGRMELDQQQKKDRAWSLIRLGVISQFRGDLQEAMSLYRQSERLFQETNDQYGLSNCYTEMGNASQLRGDYEDALQQHQKSLKISEKRNDRSGIATCHGNMANLHQARGDLEVAFELYQQSLKVWEELGNRSGLVKCCLGMGSILCRQGKLDEAMQMCKQGLEIAEELGDRDDRAKILANMGGILFLQGDYDESKQRYQQSLDIAEELGNRDAIATCCLNLGNILENLGDDDKAVEMLQRSLDIAKELGNKDAMADCYLNIGVYHSNRGDFDKALRLYQKSLEIAENINDQEVIAKCSLVMGPIYEMYGDSEKSLKLYRRARALMTELNLPMPEELQNKIVELEEENEEWPDEMPSG